MNNILDKKKKTTLDHSVNISTKFVKLKTPSQFTWLQFWIFKILKSENFLLIIKHTKRN